MDERTSDRGLFPPWNARTALAIGALAGAIFCYLLLFRDAYIDDTFITLRYVKTLSTTGTWGFYPGHPSNTATSPLNVMLLALVSLITRSPVDSVLVLTTLEFVLMAILLRAIGKKLRLEYFAPLALVGLLVNPLFMSSLGLESVLFGTFVVVGLYFFLEERFGLMALACALLTLTRPDGILFLLVCLVAMRESLPTRIRTAILYALCIAPWYLYSWVELGSIVPDTLIIKLNQNWGHNFGNGLYLYFWQFPVETFFSFLFVGAFVLATRNVLRRSCFYVILAYGIFYYFSYIVIGAPSYHWYYVPVVLCVVLLGALAVAQFVHDSTMMRGWSVHPIAAAAFALLVISVIVLFVRDGVPIREAWINSNWATQVEYKAVGEWLRTHEAGKTGVSDGEIGTIAYYCDCLMLNEFSDRAWLDSRIELSRNGTGIRGAISRINYWFYRPHESFGHSTFLLSYMKVFPKNVNAQTWQVESKWKGDGTILFNRTE